MTARATPVEAPERINSLDVLRGVAIMGILIMNIQSFSMPDAAYFFPTAYGDLSGINYGVWYLSHLFADTKFMTIFCMLFGAGIILMTGRAQSRGADPAAVHYRRMLGLGIIGAVHAYLLWMGDILFAYALCGCIAYLFRKFSVRSLIFIGLAFTALGSISMGLVGFFMTMDTPEAHKAAEGFIKEWGLTPEDMQKQLEIYRGPWLAQIIDRAPGVAAFQFFVIPIFVGWRVIGTMLIGMALFKSGALSASWRPRTYLAIAIAGLVVGLPIIALGVHRSKAINWEPIRSFFFISQYNYWAGILVALAWISVVMLLCRAPAARPITTLFAAAGRMAFTNYLAQTLLCTAYFYGGYGLGFYGKLERWEQVFVVLVVWAIEVTWSTPWLRHFRFGPAEWLWRTMTYGWGQQMRRATAAPT